MSHTPAESLTVLLDAPALLGSNGADTTRSDWHVACRMWKWWCIEWHSNAHLQVAEKEIVT